MVPFSLGLLVSCALGNGIDRLLFGSVTDFIRFYTDMPGLANWLVETFSMAEWPTFNIADVALGIGLVLFIAGGLVWPMLTGAGAEGTIPGAPDE